jgi:hypothetical protein
LTTQIVFLAYDIFQLYFFMGKLQIHPIGVNSQRHPPSMLVGEGNAI